jgi:hypothetical protein
MPLVQIIPYVADQFDPGLYVFDGGTFNSNGAFVEKADRAFNVLKDQTFNITDAYKGNFEKLGIFVFAASSVNTSELLKSRGVIFLTGVDWQIYQSHQTKPTLIPEETDWLINFSNIRASNTIFTRIIEQEVQNKIDQSPSVPMVLDTRSSVDSITIADAGTVLAQEMDTGIGASLLIAPGTSILGTAPPSTFLITTFLLEDSQTLAPSTEIIMVMSQREKVTQVTSRDINGIIVLAPVTNESVSNNLEFTM